MQGAAGILHHGLAQAQDISHAGEFRQCGDGCAQWYLRERDATHGIAGKPDVAQAAGAAIGRDITTHLAQGIASRVSVVDVGKWHIQRLDAGRVQVHQFAGIGDAVAVPVLPKFEIGKRSVIGVDNAIPIGIQIGKCGKSRGGKLSIAQPGMIAEEFRAAGDLAVAIEVAHQQGIVSSHPAALFGKAAQVMVKVDIGAVGDGFNSVAIEVENKRIAPSGGDDDISAIGPAITDIAHDAIEVLVHIQRRTASPRLISDRLTNDLRNTVAFHPCLGHGVDGAGDGFADLISGGVSACGDSACTFARDWQRGDVAAGIDCPSRRTGDQLISACAYAHYGRNAAYRHD